MLFWIFLFSIWDFIKKWFDDRGIRHICIDGWNCVWDLTKLFIIVFSWKNILYFVSRMELAVKMKGCSGKECFLDLI
jgi:hypothetical protein